MIDFYNISRLIIKKKLKILTNFEKLELKKSKIENPQIKQIKIEELIDKVESYSLIDKKKAWEAIKFKTQNRKKIQFNKPWIKYAAAAVLIGVLLTTYFFKDTKSNIPIETRPNIVKEAPKIMLPGTDKAILTLEDGSQIALEKGKSFQMQNASSNGDVIVYKADKINTESIVYNYLTIPRGGQFFIKLADGTQVWLNSETQLKYPVAFAEGQPREVELVYGEAYFEVSPSSQHNGAKFKVINQFQEVEVIGTEFNIKAYKDEFNIYTTLVDGKVTINSAGKQQKLIPSQQSNLDILSRNMTIGNVDVSSETSWRTGVFIFREKPLKDIMKVLSRWYDVDVIFENKKLENIPFKGVLSMNQDFKEILETIKSLSIIKNYEINDKQLILK